jgi:hypothetical protein
MGRRTFLTGRETELKVGVSQFSEDKTSLEVIGRVGIGTTNAEYDLDVVGEAKFHKEVRDYLNVMGPNRSVLTSTGTSVFWDSAFDPNALLGITVQEEGVPVGAAGSIQTLNFVGSNVTAEGFLGIATITVDPFEPSGDNYQIQYNQDGFFAGADKLIYNDDLERITVGRTDTGSYTFNVEGTAGFSSDVYTERVFVTDRTPAFPNELASKEYVDLFATAAITIQQAVACATSESLVTSLYYDGPVAGVGNSELGIGASIISTVNETLVIDLYEVAEGDRVLVKHQDHPAHNGYYVAISTGGVSEPWILERAADFDEPTEIVKGAFSFVVNGAINGANGFVLINIEPEFNFDGTGYVGLSSLHFTQFSGAGSIDAGDGLYSVGNQLNVGTASSSRIVVNADDIDLAPVNVSSSSTTDRFDYFISKVTTDGFGRVSGLTSARYQLASTLQEGVVRLDPTVFEVSNLGITTLTEVVNARNINATGIITASMFNGNIENTGTGGNIDIDFINAGIITAQFYYGDGSNLENILTGVGLATETEYIGGGATSLEFRGRAITSVALNELTGIGTITIDGGRDMDDVGAANQVLYKNADNLVTGSVNLTFDGNNLVCGGNVTANSDESLKTNITHIDDALGKVIGLRGVEFDYKETGNHSIGLIAQEVEQVLPELVHESEEGIKSVAYQNIVAVLIEAVKEQQIQIELLKYEINELKSRGS